MLSFDIISFFNSASLTKTIDILLDHVTICKEEAIVLTEDGMKKVNNVIY